MMEAERTQRSLKTRWADFLRKSGLKTTQQRELIVETFLRSKGHVSIDELLARVRRRNPRVGYATVYRTLKLLADGGIAESRQFGDQQTRFEVADGASQGHHDHLICTECNLILEFENDEIERLQAEVAAQLGGFKITKHKLELYGLCPRAQGQKGGYCPKEIRSESTV